MQENDPSATINGAVQPRYGEVLIRHRGRLPHWEKEEGLYFFTMHLADSLPKSVLDKIAERHSILQAAQRNGARLLPDQQVFVAGLAGARSAIRALHPRWPKLSVIGMEGDTG